MNSPILSWIAQLRKSASRPLFSLALLGFEADDESVLPYSLQESKRNSLLHDPVTTWAVTRKPEGAVEAVTRAEKTIV